MKNNGFTLLELMIVLSILGILVQISTPNMVKYRIKAYQSEARVILGAIASCQMQYKLRTGAYVSCPRNPPHPHSMWNADMPEWKRIGFSIGSRFHYQYEVVADERGFVAYAHGSVGNEQWKISSDQLEPICVTRD